MSLKINSSQILLTHNADVVGKDIVHDTNFGYMPSLEKLFPWVTTRDIKSQVLKVIKKSATIYFVSNCSRLHLLIFMM